MMDWGFVSKAWDKWASISVGSSGQPLKAAFLINYEPSGPSRLLPDYTWSHQFMKAGFAAALLLIGVYEGSVDSASRAMFAVDQFAWQVGRRNL